ncbi:hypothetical protein OIU79_029272 [Salix purpurea]|uniref:FAS1 domain-containing protein n=1 Tax=Salix purpurea TaxID=77065 RepID=A0A9Q0VG82_SALPP|nr:hypothetical protein OIU79_029272 [Salix purpurea]
MAPQFLFSFSFILSFLLYCPPTLAQSPAAAPGPPGPANVTKILEKGGQFSVFTRLLKATREDVTLNGQLNNTNNAITIFAPSDSAFSSLKPGTLNSLNDQEKAELVQFHIIPQYLSSSQFQTVSNPLTTQAGSGGRLELNVDKVLLPVDIFTPKPPPPAPAPEKTKKGSKSAESPDTAVDNSGAVTLNVLDNAVFFGVGIVAVIFSL